MVLTKQSVFKVWVLLLAVITHRRLPSLQQLLLAKMALYAGHAGPLIFPSQNGLQCPRFVFLTPFFSFHYRPLRTTLHSSLLLVHCFPLPSPCLVPSLPPLCALLDCRGLSLSLLRASHSLLFSEAFATFNLVFISLRLERS